MHPSYTSHPSLPPPTSPPLPSPPGKKALIQVLGRHDYALSRALAASPHVFHASPPGARDAGASPSTLPRLVALHPRVGVGSVVTGVEDFKVGGVGRERGGETRGRRGEEKWGTYCWATAVVKDVPEVFVVGCYPEASLTISC